MVAAIPSAKLQDLRRSPGITWAQRDTVRHEDGLVDPEAVYTGDPEFLPWSVSDVRADRVWPAWISRERSR